jgi:hypothetical protein
MKFASTKQIIAMIVVSAALLYALDYWKNPQLWHKEMATSANQTHLNKTDLTLWINGACSLEDARQALSGVEGIDLAHASAVAPGGGSSAADSSTAVAFPSPGSRSWIFPHSMGHCGKMAWLPAAWT